MKQFIGDYRLQGALKRLSRIKHVIPVVSGKGGVGKTVIASTMALLGARHGLHVGLLDLDLTNPNTHIVLGVDTKASMPEEEKGVNPVNVHGLEFMTIAFYTGDNPLPLRGESTVNAMLEILSITNWSTLDILFVDMPPGLRDEVLELLRIVRHQIPLAVVQSSRLGLVAAKRLLRLLNEEGIKQVPVVENMVHDKPLAKPLIEEYDVYYLGYVRRDPSIDNILGSPQRLLATQFASDVSNCFNKLLDLLNL